MSVVDTTDILIADDQSLLRHSLATVINAEPDLRVVAQAAGGTEAVELTRRHRPALVLMDLRMPDLDGIAATRHLLKTATHDLKVLVLTMFDLDEYVHGALLAGASGFLLKDTDPPRLLDAIRRTVAGESLFAPTVLQRLVEHYVRRPGGRTSVPPGLTDRETEVLTLLGTLCALNRIHIEHPSFKWSRQLTARFTRAPSDFDARLRSAIAAGPREGAPELHALLTETAQLVTVELPAVDVARIDGILACRR